MNNNIKKNITMNMSKVMNNSAKVMNNSMNNMVKNINNTLNNTKKNITPTTSVSSDKWKNMFKNVDKKVVIKSICIILLLCIVIYFVVCYVNYSKKECYKKKSFLEYAFDFSDSSPCQLENAPMPPQKPIPEPSPVKIIPVSESKKEVFHIANQDYTYDQAKCKCESYGATLATKNDMVQAFNNGASWCTYGWTDGQSAYYPVQQCDWDNIETEKKKYHKDSEQYKKLYCGHPGLNGGFFPNSNLKFGVNCYGVKPKGNKQSKLKAPYCAPMNFCKLEDNFYASHKLDTDEISPFSPEMWSENM